MSCRNEMSVLLSGVLALSTMSMGAVIVDDKFDDGGITNGTDAKDVAWVKTLSTRPVQPAYVSNYGTAGNTTGALNFVYSASGGADASNSAAVKGSFSGQTLDHADPTANTIKLSFDFRYMGMSSGGTASNSAFRMGLGTSTEGHAFQFSNAASASNPSLTIYQDQDKLSGAELATLGGKSPGLTINETTNNHTFVMLIERTGANTADYSVSIDGSTPWQWSLLSTAGVSNFTFDRVLLGAGTGGVRMNYRVDNVLVEVVPEPASIGLLGLASLGLLRRRHA